MAPDDAGDARDIVASAQVGAKPEASTPDAESEGVGLSGTAPGGTGLKMKMVSHPGSAQYRVTVLLLSSVAAAVWLVAAAWAFGYAVKLSVWWAAASALVPALLLLGCGAWLALSGIRSDKDGLHDPTGRRSSGRGGGS